MSSLNSRDYGKSTPTEVVGLGVFITIALMLWGTFGLWWAGYWWAGEDTVDLGPRILAGQAPWLRESTILAVAAAIVALALALLVGLLIRKFKGRRKKEDIAASHMGRPEEVAHMTLKARRKQAKRLGGRYQA